MRLIDVKEAKKDEKIEKKVAQKLTHDEESGKKDKSDKAKLEEFEKEKKEHEKTLDSLKKQMYDAKEVD